MDLETLWNDITAELLPMLLKYRQRLDRLDINLKPDDTLLTEADVAVEKRIIELIRERDAEAVIVAEEDNRVSMRTDVLTEPEFVWVIDPIDGTAQFVKPDEREYCSVVCLMQNRIPRAALVIAPELGTDRTPLIVKTMLGSGEVFLNDLPVRRPERSAQWISATRSAGVPPREFESRFVDQGYSIKTRTTSQTLDMVRTAIDLDGNSDLRLPHFDLFYRRSQKIWDGVAGLCLAGKTGLRTVRASGDDRLPVPIELLAEAKPAFDSTIVGVDRQVDDFLAWNSQ